MDWKNLFRRSVYGHVLHDGPPASARRAHVRASHWAIVLFLACSGAAAQPNIAGVVEALGSSDVAARHRAAEEAGQLGPEAILAIAPLADSETPGVAQAARQALEKITGSASAEAASRRAAADALTIAAMSAKDRRWMLWLLSYVGDAEAVPALVSICEKVPEARDMACLALERVARTARAGDPARRARMAEAIREAAVQAEGPVRAGLWTALGGTGEPRAADVLLAEMRVRGVASDAAAGALGDLGDPAHAEALWAHFLKTGSTQALDACLRLVEAMPAKKAARFYRQMIEAAKGNGDARVLCAALLGLGQMSGDKDDRAIMASFAEDVRADVAGAAEAALEAFEARRGGHQDKGAKREGD